jgi:hypothetical protein
MKYETPEMTVLTPAINAIQAIKNPFVGVIDSLLEHELAGAYADWE